MTARDRLIDRVIERLNTTPLPARPELPLPNWPNGAHGEHVFDGWCSVCRARDVPGALRNVVAAVLTIAEEAAREDDALRREAAGRLARDRRVIADAFGVPVEMLGPAAMFAICDECGHTHVYADACRAEVSRERGAPLPPERRVHGLLSRALDRVTLCSCTARRVPLAAAT